MKDLKEKFSEFLGENISEVILFNSGYLSQGYKLIAEKKIYFARTIKSGVPGYEYLKDDSKGFSISDFMMNNSYERIKSYGKYKIGNSYYHITDFIEGEIIWDLHMSEEDVKMIAEKIGILHLKGKDNIINLNDSYKDFLYKRSFREIITNNETLFSVYENNIHSFNNKEVFQKLIRKMIEEYFKYIDNIDTNRLTTLHGDFWNGNFLKDKEGYIHFIDFSRIPYGEPGIDIGRFLSQFDIDIIVKGKDTFQTQLKNIFLNKYIEITGDNEITKYIRLSTLWVIFIQLSPLVQKFLNWDDSTISNLQKWALEY